MNLLIAFGCERDKVVILTRRPCIMMLKLKRGRFGITKKKKNYFIYRYWFICGPSDRVKFFYETPRGLYFDYR